LRGGSCRHETIDRHQLLSALRIPLVLLHRQTNPSSSRRSPSLQSNGIKMSRNRRNVAVGRESTSLALQIGLGGRRLTVGNRKWNLTRWDVRYWSFGATGDHSERRENGSLRCVPESCRLLALLWHPISCILRDSSLSMENSIESKIWRREGG